MRLTYLSWGSRIRVAHLGSVVNDLIEVAESVAQAVKSGEFRVERMRLRRLQ